MNEAGTSRAPTTVATITPRIVVWDLMPTSPFVKIELCLLDCARSRGFWAVV